MLVEVRRAVCDADLRQAGPPWLERHESHVSLKIGGVLGAGARLHALPDRSDVITSVRLRTIYVLGLFLTVAYFAHTSVLPVNAASESQSLGGLGQKVRSVMPAARLTWWIRASWLIWGNIAPLINREALINHVPLCADEFWLPARAD
jgi:hypothetical protein